MLRLLICLPLCLALAPSYPRAPLAAVESDTHEVAGAAVDKRLPNPKTDPIGFLEACLRRYDEQKIRGYSLIFRKQERIEGQQKALEIVIVHYKGDPHSVYFQWEQPPNRTVRRALYVEGENKAANGLSQIKILASLGIKMDKPPDGAEAKQQSRYAMNVFGVKEAMQIVLKTWKAAQAEKALVVEYLGQHVVPETGHRVCYKFRRSQYAKPEEDGVQDLILYVDRDTLLQVGWIAGGAEGVKLGEYYFRDIRLNPTLEPWQFTPAALDKK